MFNNKNRTITKYDHRISYKEISKNVFDSLKSIKFKKATLKDIVGEFQNRYHYYPDTGRVTWDGQITDSRGGSWYDSIGKYCGGNSELLEKILQETIKQENMHRELGKEERQILKRGPKEVPFACAGQINHSTKNPYTELQIEKFKKYQEELDVFKRTDEEYLANDKKQRDYYYRNNSLQKLRKKLATFDAKTFLKDHEGKFVFIISYSDHDSDGCIMEHGGVFKTVPHVQVSHH
jgi:hypothetical protein